MMTRRHSPRAGTGSLSGRGAIVAVAALVTVGLLLARGPIPQPESYHLFADSRSLFGIFGFWNVVSNVPFVLVGAWGLTVVLRRCRPVVPIDLRPAYLAIFSGGILCGLGSAWYHHAPGNATLLWDRMAMAVTFMAFAALVVGERIRPAAGRALLVPLMLVGIFSTISWYRSELAGRGDLRLYLLIQFLPLLLTPLILLLWRSPTAERRRFGAAVAAYALAKIAEILDGQVYQLTRGVSGHTLKHLLAALALALLALGVVGAGRSPGGGGAAGSGS